MTITLKNKDEVDKFCDVCKKYSDDFLIMDIYQKEEIPLRNAVIGGRGMDFNDLSHEEMEKFINKPFYFEIGDDRDVYDLKNNLDAFEEKLKEEGIDVTYELDGEAYYGEYHAE